MYLPTAQIPGGNDRLREQSFTAWLSPDLHQAAIEFQRNIGLLPLYIECNEELKRRAIYCHLPTGSKVTAHSGRMESQFLTLDERYREKKFRLLSLHILETRRFSAVWIDAPHWDQGSEILGGYGLSAARVRE